MIGGHAAIPRALSPPRSRPRAPPRASPLQACGDVLPKVAVHRFCCAPFTNVESYRRMVGDELINEILGLAHELRGIRVCHLNSTGFGGGVVELLSLAP